MKNRTDELLKERGQNQFEILKKILTYFVTAILFCFYISILILSTKPNVSMEYTKYYIDKELKSWNGEGSFSYVLGEPIVMCKPNEIVYGRLSNGWSNLEEDGCWTDGEIAKIYFSDLPRENLKLNIDISACNTMDKILFEGNGRELASIMGRNLKGGEKINLEIPKSIINYGVFELKIHINSPQSPPNDGRKLGVKVKEVRIHE